MPPFYLIIAFNYYITSPQTTCKNHSTIFNSFDNKDKITERLGILGKSFDDIHKSIQQRKDDIEKLKKDNRDAILGTLVTDSEGKAAMLLKDFVKKTEKSIQYR